MNVFTASVVEKCVGILSNSISVDFFSPVYFTVGSSFYPVTPGLLFKTCASTWTYLVLRGCYADKVNELKKNKTNNESAARRVFSFFLFWDRPSRRIFAVWFFSWLNASFTFWMAPRGPWSQVEETLNLTDVTERFLSFLSLSLSLSLQL